MPSAKTADTWNVVAKDDHYEARLAEAIAKSCDLMHRFKVNSLVISCTDLR